MERLDLVIGWAIVAFGSGHTVATPFFVRPPRGERALWFASGGLFMVLVGALNLLRLTYASVAPGLLAVCFAANLAATAFAVMLAAVIRPTPRHAPQVLLAIVVFAAATVLSWT